MKNRRSSPILRAAVCLLLLLSSLPVFAQNVPGSRPRDEAPRVFIDCHQCDMNHIRREITFVTFVRDRKSADVYLMVSIRQTGGGGREYVVDFIGQGPYVDLKSSMKYVSSPNDSADIERRGLARVMKIGLVPFAAQTSVGGFLDVNFDGRPAGILRDDRWNSWVFTTGVSGSLSGESVKRFTSLSGYFSANRITRGSKLRLSLSGSLRDSYYELDEGSISATMDSESFSGLYVFSLNDHWSVGSWLSVSSSSYSNISLSVNPAPALEYNFFPYTESARRQLRFLYCVGLTFYKYMEETVYERTRETILGHSLSVAFEIKEPWGYISTSISGSTHLSDLKKNRIAFYSGVSLQIVKGLSLNFSGRYSRINDQVYLPMRAATTEEVLLQLRESATSYSYGLSVGVSYTFGSIFSPVVNPRFGT